MMSGPTLSPVHVTTADSVKAWAARSRSSSARYQGRLETNTRSPGCSAMFGESPVSAPEMLTLKAVGWSSEPRTTSTCAFHAFGANPPRDAMAESALMSESKGTGPGEATSPRT